MNAYQYAGFGRRFVAMAIDSALIFLVTGAIQLGIVALMMLPDALAESGQWQWRYEDVWNQVFAAVVTIAAWVKFFGTPGKLMCDCYVVDEATGQRISWRQAFLRYVGYIVALLPFGLGFLWIIWDPQKRGWHDRIARTRVITSPARQFDDESHKPLYQLIREIR